MSKRERGGAKAIEFWPTDRLIPYANNARTHSDEQVDKVAGSINEFGFTNPILVDKQSGIIAGHCRLLAARKLGLEEVPVIILDHLTDSQRRAYILADNKLALDAGWDFETLNIEIERLAEESYDVGLTGFSEEELEQLRAEFEASHEDSDDAGGEPDQEDGYLGGEPKKEPVTLLGDLWKLGQHRLKCGDSTRPQVVKDLLNGATPNLMVTDPPYGVSYDANWRNEALRVDDLGGKKKVRAGILRGRAVGKVENDDCADWTKAWELFKGNVAYVWHSGNLSRSFQTSLESQGFVVRNQIIWAKTMFAIGRGHYHWQHEPCFYAVRNGATGNWQGARDQATVWHISHKSSETGHSTQKPIECMLRPILNNSEEGDLVYEPFSGSGTTIIAGQRSGRVVLAVEIHPGYVDMAIERWEAETGEEAVLQGADGKTFKEMAQIRGARKI